MVRLRRGFLMGTVEWAAEHSLKFPLKTLKLPSLASSAAVIFFLPSGHYAGSSDLKISSLACCICLMSRISGQTAASLAVCIGVFFFIYGEFFCIRPIVFTSSSTCLINNVGRLNNIFRSSALDNKLR